jgi:hypothetical protein
MRGEPRRPPFATPSLVVVADGLAPEVQRAHDDAVAAGREFYIDPRSGLLVMTSKYLSDRGYCCNNNCRHCPYRG